MVDEDTLQKLWKIANEVSVQQQANQDLASGLRSQLHDLKQRTTVDTEASAAAAQRWDTTTLDPAYLTGQQEKDLPTDDPVAILNAKCNALMEAHQATLARNQKLERECADLRGLVYDYETNLEQITSKLRNHTVASMQGQAQLRREFEALLDAEKNVTATLLMENMDLRQRVHKVAEMLRQCNQENADDETSLLQWTQLRAENQGLRDLLQLSKVSQKTSTVDTASNKHSPQKHTMTGQSGIIDVFFCDEENSPLS
ncbi:hypothetical protein BCR43DRAFT_499891 [Syncephalastrum racemosum]|uniref:Uncharacterized protein n=1 Tax=Syncephalastrum racemosum TaxID=13706 RepID=A0A1X2GZS1_SYNRA|nr:hypothetical protein BCR43DRAFT_499891 [Syncephalastrum racemosum]